MMSNTATHVHGGEICNGKRYLHGEFSDMRFSPCPNTPEGRSPLAKQVGMLYEETEMKDDKPQRPSCELKGCSKPAKLVLVWDIDSGRITKYACQACADTNAGHRRHFVAAMLGVSQ